MHRGSCAVCITRRSRGAFLLLLFAGLCGSGQHGKQSACVGYVSQYTWLMFNLQALAIRRAGVMLTDVVVAAATVQV